MIVTLWIISIISFVVIQLPPGDYLTTLAINLEESGYPVEEAMLERYRIRFGLDKTLFEQYFIWITNFVQGDMGYSFGWKANVNTLIWERLLLTIVLSMSSLILTWLISIPIGVYSALKQHSVGDYAFTILGLAGVSVPSFMLALVLMYLAFSKFGVDVGGLFSPQYEGAMRIAMNPFISSFAYILPALISGSTIISVVMNMPTTGPLLLGALQTQDMYLAGSFIMLLSALTVIGTFFSDLLLATIDPRVRFF